MSLESQWGEAVSSLILRLLRSATLHDDRVTGKSPYLASRLQAARSQVGR